MIYSNPAFRFTLIAISIVFSLSLSSQAEVFLLTGDANNEGHASDSVAYDLSSDGRYVLFITGPANSGSSPGITRGGIYVRDLATGGLQYVNNSSDAVAGEGAISADGRYVAYRGNDEALFLKDRLLGTSTRINKTTSLFVKTPDGECRGVQVSDDGRFVAYATVARNLLEDSSAVPPGNAPYVVVWDRETGESAVASVAHDSQALDKGFGGVNAAEEFALSADGRYLFFSSDSTNTHPDRASAANQAWFWMYRRDLETGTVEIVSKREDGGIPTGNFTTPSVSKDGRYALFTGGFVGSAGGGNLVDGHSNPSGADLFRKDMDTGAVVLASPTSDGAAPNGFFDDHDLSGNGQVAAFASSARNFAGADDDGAEFDVFKASFVNGSSTISMISQAAGSSENIQFHNGPYATDDYIAFGTGDWDIIRGLPESVPYFHSVAVGTEPVVEAGTGASFEIIEPEGFYSGIAMSSDASRWLIHDFSNGFKLIDEQDGESLITGTQSIEPLSVKGDSSLNRFVARGTWNDAFSFILWDEDSGVTALPTPPGFGEVSVRLLGIFDDGDVLFSEPIAATDAIRVNRYTSGSGYTELDTGSGTALAEVTACLPSGVLFGTAENPDNDFYSKPWRWEEGSGFELLGWPEPDTPARLHFLAFNQAGTAFLVRAEAFPQDGVYLWRQGRGYTLVGYEDELPFFTDMSPDGGLFFYISAISSIVSGPDGSLLSLVDELLLFGADAEAFASGKFENIRAARSVGGETVLFGNFRSNGSDIDPFIARLPYQSLGTEGTVWPGLNSVLGGSLEALGGDWFWHPQLDLVYAGDDSGWFFSVELNTWIFSPSGQEPSGGSTGLFLYLADADGLAANGGGTATSGAWVALMVSSWQIQGTDASGQLHAFDPVGGLTGWLRFSEEADANRMREVSGPGMIVVRSATPED